MDAGDSVAEPTRGRPRHDVPLSPSVGLHQLKFDDTGCAGHWNNDAL
jgi:hypothetical protein